MVEKIVAELRNGGVRGLALAVYRRFLPFRVAALREHREAFVGKDGLEVGGPSGLFEPAGCLPVYTLARTVANCNFAGRTVWGGEVRPGETFREGKAGAKGRQYVAEATDLGQFPSGSFDFVLSSHVLEHTANPLKALREWIRLLKDDGTLVLVLPHKEGTFDHRRPVTPLSHLIQDFEAGVDESDLTHLEEILKLHDRDLDPEAGTLEEFRQRSLRNVENRCLHHHVFDTALAAEIVDHVGLQILAVEAFLSCNIMVIARKRAAGLRGSNAGFTERACASSPFESDRRRSPQPV